MRCGPWSRTSRFLSYSACHPPETSARSAIVERQSPDSTTYDSSSTRSSEWCVTLLPPDAELPFAPLSVRPEAEPPDGEPDVPLAPRRPQVGQAPIPCERATRSPTAICSDRVARSARGAYCPPP